MKKLYKNKSQNKYENLSWILNDKTDYLKNLEKKRNDGLKIIRNQKANILFEDIFKLNKFNRDYSCFSSGLKFENQNIALNKNLSQIIRYPLKKKIIKNYSNQKIHDFQENYFINNYSQVPKKHYQIRNDNISKKRSKLLAKVSKEIIFKNSLNNNTSDNIKIKLLKKY